MADEPVEDRFDALVARLDTAMVVVTTAAGHERDGCLVGFHSQAGIHPRRYLVWLSMENRTFRIASAASHLAVHLLGTDDHELAERFGGATADEPGVDKLAGLAWQPGPGGVPLLDDLPARFAGRILTRLEAPDADHAGFVLEPVASGTEGPPVPDAAPLRLHHVTDIDAGHEA